MTNQYPTTPEMTPKELSAVVNIWLELNTGHVSDAADMATLFVNEPATTTARARRARFILFLGTEFHA